MFEMLIPKKALLVSRNKENFEKVLKLDPVSCPDRLFPQNFQMHQMASNFTCMYQMLIQINSAGFMKF